MKDLTLLLSLILSAFPSFTQLFPQHSLIPYELTINKYEGMREKEDEKIISGNCS